MSIDRVVAAADHVVIELTGHGTHTGPMVTPRGTIEPTGRSLELKLCDVHEFRDGKVVSQNNYLTPPRCSSSWA